MSGINDPGEIARALKTARTIAVVGCSPNGNRPSHAIASYLLSAGFDVIPVNPGHTEILGRTCYPDLASIPKDVRLDIVDVFRRSEFVPGIADAALARILENTGFSILHESGAIAIVRTSSHGGRR